MRIALVQNVDARRDEEQGVDGDHADDERSYGVVDTCVLGDGGRGAHYCSARLQYMLLVVSIQKVFFASCNATWVLDDELFFVHLLGKISHSQVILKNHWPVTFAVLVLVNEENQQNDDCVWPFHDFRKIL